MQRLTELDIQTIASYFLVQKVFRETAGDLGVVLQSAITDAVRQADLSSLSPLGRDVMLATQGDQKTDEGKELYDGILFALDYRRLPDDAHPDLDKIIAQYFDLTREQSKGGV
jgi:hypothetical protein